MTNDISKILFEKQAIDIAVENLAKTIFEDYKDKEVIVLSLLSGSFVFTSDLVRQINIPLSVEFVKAKSYQGIESTGVVVLDEHFEPKQFNNKHVLVVDDILDTGLTLETITNLILRESKALSVKTCVLLDKNTKKRNTHLHANYTCFKIPDEFVVGYGLDYDGKYRNLPYIGILNEEIYNG